MPLYLLLPKGWWKYWARVRCRWSYALAAICLRYKLLLSRRSECVGDAIFCSVVVLFLWCLLLYWLMQKGSCMMKIAVFFFFLLLVLDFLQFYCACTLVFTNVLVDVWRSIFCLFTFSFSVGDVISWNVLRFYTNLNIILLFFSISDVWFCNVVVRVRCCLYMCTDWFGKRFMYIFCNFFSLLAILGLELYFACILVSSAVLIDVRMFMY